MKRYYGIVPKDLETYIYLSQLLQAEGIKRAVEAHRRARPFCMGTLYWQLNDCWPAVSWSSIDYYGRWKALHYFIHKAFSPVLISPIVEKGLLRVYVINDLPNRFSAKMQLQLLDFEGKILWNQIIPVEILPLSSAIKFEKSVGEVLKGSDRTKTVLYVALKREEELLSENLLYFTAAKELSLKKPYVKYEIKKEGEGFTISLSSKNLAKNLYLSYAGEGCFSDNFFDLLPGKIRKIKLLTEESPERVKSRIKFMSLWDCLNSFKEDENN
jgi:beta-mannosidase